MLVPNVYIDRSESEFRALFKKRASLEFLKTEKIFALNRAIEHPETFALTPADQPRIVLRMLDAAAELVQTRHAEMHSVVQLAFNVFMQPESYDVLQQQEDNSLRARPLRAVAPEGSPALAATDLLFKVAELGCKIPPLVYFVTNHTGFYAQHGDSAGTSRLVVLQAEKFRPMEAEAVSIYQAVRGATTQAASKPLEEASEILKGFLLKSFTDNLRMTNRELEADAYAEAQTNLANQQARTEMIAAMTDYFALMGQVHPGFVQKNQMPQNLMRVVL